MDNELAEIKEITGTDVNVCACKECINQCKTAPCLGTPSDILKIIAAGYKNQIAFTKWGAGIKQNIPPITMLQPYFDIERGCCTFLDENKKNCTLHDAGLKPTEGKLSHHSYGELGVKMGINLPIAHAVALTWVEDHNMPVVTEILNELRDQLNVKDKNQ